MAGGDVEAGIAERALVAVVGEPWVDLVRLAAGMSSAAFAGSTVSGRWVVRVPALAPGRSLNYRSESTICAVLRDLGHPVATWTNVEVDGLVCSVGPRLDGVPVSDDEPFTPAFAAQLGRALSDLHQIAVGGFGPLADDERLHGTADANRAGVVARWHLARIWPFDDTDLSTHPVAAIDPDLVERIEPLRAAILDAADGPIGLLHSDLHREHLFRDESGSLTGLLDFGDAFVGARAWDFALLHWYYGRDNARAVAAHYGGADGLDEHARTLAIAVGLYKLDKAPTTPSTHSRLRQVLDDLA